MRQLEQSQESRCPFCRKPAPKTMAESWLNVMKRVEANDPLAMKTMGAQRYCEGDYGSAFEYYTKAAVSHFGAHFQLSNMYREGQGVEKDLKKELYHAEQAAIGGHPVARYKHHGRMDRAVKHYMIAASLGDHNSLEALKQSYKEGLVTKEDFAAALRAHQTAIQQKVHKEREPKIFS